ALLEAVDKERKSGNPAAGLLILPAGCDPNEGLESAAEQMRRDSLLEERIRNQFANTRMKRAARQFAVERGIARERLFPTVPDGVAGDMMILGRPEIGRG